MSQTTEEEEIESTVEDLILMAKVVLVVMGGFIGIWFLMLAFESYLTPKGSILDEINYGFASMAPFAVGVYLHSLWE